ncbi:MAG: YjgP/YjgQ family permease [Chlorobi bacterium]|nr:YjgP/YjgQ family permease [Chlorobiota bacterium]
MKVTLIDKYLVKKFLGTFLFAILMIVSIAVVFDLSEKLDNFIEKQAPFKAIVFDYYLNFIPYFAVLFSSLFTFISVIYFTAKLAYNSEITAMLSNGISIYRLLIPYMVAAFIIALSSFLVNNFILPHANRKRLDFEEVYYHGYRQNVTDINIHRQVRPNIYIYMETYSTISNLGRKFSMEQFDDQGRLKSKLIADFARWDTTVNKWNVRNYYIRTIDDSLHEHIETGRRLDTTLYVTPDDFGRRENIVETMNLGELKRFVAEQRLQGADNIEVYEIALYNRYSNAFSAFILTLIGFSLSVRRMKGGIGVQIGFGIALSFAYIIFMQFSAQFAIGGNINPLLASWIPNIIFSFVALGVFVIVPK